MLELPDVRSQIVFDRIVKKIESPITRTIQMMLHAQIETQLLVLHAASAAWTAQGRFPEAYVLHAECDRGPHG